MNTPQKEIQNFIIFIKITPRFHSNSNAHSYLSEDHRKNKIKYENWIDLFGPFNFTTAESFYD